MRTGRLSQSVLRQRGRVRFDPDLAVKEWTANRGEDRNPSALPLDLSLAKSRQRYIDAQTRQVELAIAVRARELVELREVEARWTALVVEWRTQWEGFATRVKQRLPHLTTTDVATISTLARELCEEHATGGTHATQATG